MRPNFKYEDLSALNSGRDPETVKEGESLSADAWMTSEGIAVKKAYTSDDLKGMEHLGYAAGLPPFLRGPYSGMYTMMPRKIPMHFTGVILLPVRKVSLLHLTLPRTEDMILIMKGLQGMLGKQVLQ
jgi:hypothetical protein